MEDISINEDSLVSKNNSIFSLKCFLILVPFNIFLIIYIILILYYIKNNNSENMLSDINQISYNYLKYSTKLAISEKRLAHLFTIKDKNEDYYDKLISLEKTIIKLGWEQLLINKKELLIELNKNITNFLYLPQKDINNNISNFLFRIMIENEPIKNYQENKNIQYIIKKLKNIEENEIMKNRLNNILLYAFINLPLQFSFFSQNSAIKTNFTNEAFKHITSFPHYQTFNNINRNMGISSNNSIYMVLGSTQEEELRRMTAKSPDIPYINICNVGIRPQFSESELKSFLVENINKYYTNSQYKNIIMQCTSYGLMNEEVYNNFVNDCNNLLYNPNLENVALTFEKYNFSIETANTVIDYLKLNIPLDDIIILRLGEKNKENAKIKYNKNKVYILFNVIDVSKTYYLNYTITRATTEANAKVIYYLINECKNFFKKEDYKNIVLVSNQLNAERQLETFNIISKIFKYGYEFNYVIWNKQYEIELTDKKISDYICEIISKSYNLISNSLKKINIEKYSKNKDKDLLRINQFIQEIIDLTEKIKL